MAKGVVHKYHLHSPAFTRMNRPQRQPRHAFTLRCLAALVVFTVPASVHAADDYTIGVSVDMVVLQATALDHKGTLVSGLGENDFQIYEDGILQPIKHFSHDDIPVTVGLVIDNSGSMRPKRHDVIAAGLPSPVPATRRTRCSWSTSTRRFHSASPSQFRSPTRWLNWRLFCPE